MTDRERLTELLNNFVYDIILCDTCEILDRDCAACENERLADYLIEHGVIVLPCKAEDTLYEKQLQQITESKEEWDRDFLLRSRS